MSLPNIGQYIKCIFRNGVTSEGVVEEWNDKMAQLRSLDGKSILIITNPTADIMLIKIMLEDTSDLDNAPAPVLEETIQEDDDHKPAILINPYNVDYNKNLVELRKEKAEQERRILTEKLREHIPTMGSGKVKYEQPGFYKK